MAEKNNDANEEKFSDDPEENLRMQNDFLKLKMMAESGAVMGGSGNLPPDIENQFLKNILEFEKLNAESKPLKVFDFLKAPTFKKSSALNDREFETEYSKLQNLLKEFAVEVEFKKDRSDRFKYDFITGELFEHQIAFTPVKGMTTYFLYEEFHPDYEADISELTEDFLNDYLNMKINDQKFYLANDHIEPDGNVVSKEELVKRFQDTFEIFKEINNGSFVIEKIDFNLTTGDRSEGMGNSEGGIKYDIILNDGKKIKIDGPFKIYFNKVYGMWEIFFFYLPGFNTHPSEK